MPKKTGGHTMTNNKSRYGTRLRWSDEAHDDESAVEGYMTGGKNRQHRNNRKERRTRKEQGWMTNT